MSAKKAPPDANHLISEYRSGKSVEQIIRETGWPKNRTWALARELKIIDPNRRIEVLHRPEFSLLKRQQTSAWWKKASPDQRTAQVFGAHSIEARKKQSKTMENNWARKNSSERKEFMTQTHHGLTHEREFMDMMSLRGIQMRRQFRVGDYRADFFITNTNILIEICGNYLPGDTYRSIRKERIYHILNAGYGIIFVHIGKKESVGIGAADYVISFLEIFRTNESSRGKYWVIGSSGDPISSGSIDDVDFAFK